MFYLDETLQTYNWFVSLTTAILGDTLNSWVGRSKDSNISQYEFKLAKEKSGNDSLEYPYRRIVNVVDRVPEENFTGFSFGAAQAADRSGVLYKLHIFVDPKAHWENTQDSGISPIDLRRNVKGIDPILGIIIPEDVFIFNIDKEYLKDTKTMYRNLREYYKYLFGAMFSVPGKFVSNFRISEVCFGVLADIYLTKMTTYSMNTFFDQEEEMFKEQYEKSKEIKFTFAQPIESEWEQEHKDEKNKFIYEQNIEECKYLRKFTEDILDSVTVDGSPQIKNTELFKRYIAEYLDYIEYKDYIRDKKLQYFKGPTIIPV